MGAIDTILGTNIDTYFSKIEFNHNLVNINNNIHTFQNLLSFYDNDKYFYTIDIQDNNFLIEKDKIENVISFSFINNSFITLNNEKNLKAYNIKNKKLFWNTDLSEYLDKDNKIVEVLNNENRIIIFLNNGLILEIDLISGELLFNQKLNLKEIRSIYFVNNYVLFNQIDGNTTLFKQ